MSGRASARKKAASGKRKYSGILNIPGAIKVSKGKKYLGQDVLLTESIYNGNVPESSKGMLFHYTVASYDEKDECFSAKYMKKAVKVGTSLFFAFEENEDSSISGISFKDVKDGQKKYHDASKVTIVAAANEADKVRKVLENQRKDPDKIELSDINHILENHPAGGKAEEILLLEFEKLDHEGNDPEKKQRWRHKSTGRAFWQYRTASKKKWDSGVWGKQLAVIASGKIQAIGNVDAIARARYMLSIRSDYDNNLAMSPSRSSPYNDQSPYKKPRK
jgi:hypothetical protein